MDLSIGRSYHSDESLYTQKLYLTSAARRTPEHKGLGQVTQRAMSPAGKPQRFSHIRQPGKTAFAAIR